MADAAMSLGEEIQAGAERRFRPIRCPRLCATTTESISSWRPRAYVRSWRLCARRINPCYDCAAYKEIPVQAGKVADSMLPSRLRSCDWSGGNEVGVAGKMFHQPILSLLIKSLAPYIRLPHRFASGAIQRSVDDFQ